MNTKHYFSIFIISVFVVLTAICNSGCKGKTNKEKGIDDPVSVQTDSNKTNTEKPAAPELNAVVHLDDQTFDKNIATGVVLVDFWATWCRPCKLQGPIVEEVNKDMKGRAKICKLDIDNGPLTAQKFGVENIPTLIIFKNGKEAKRFVGVTQKADLVIALDMLIK